MTRIYHQCGHNHVWNIDSLKNNFGDGLILSPVNHKMKDVIALGDNLKLMSVFDPQFYLPNSQKKNFMDYSFFPETMGGESGFSTVDFAQLADESAQKCLSFQNENNFEKIVIPARFFPQMISTWIQQQEIFVRPFLNQIESQKITKPVYQTVPVTQHMITDVVFREKILNWVTGFQRIDGIYLLISVVEDSKQIRDGNLIYEILKFLKTCANANLKVLVGYTNAEVFALSLAGDFDFTMGSFENTRRFSDERFIDSDEEMRGPKARIYIPSLFTWIQFNHAKEIKRADAAFWNTIHRDTAHSIAAFQQPKEPSFNQPALYKHYFEIFYAQAKEYMSLDRKARYMRLREDFKKSRELYEKIENLPIDLDRHAKGDHVEGWLDAINRFYRDFSDL